MYDSAEPNDAPGASDTASPVATPAVKAHGGADGSLPGAPGAIVSAASGAEGAETAVTTDQVRLALRRVKDPELNLNILDLGLIYEMTVEGVDVSIDMSLTSPGCPSGPEIMGDAERQLRSIPGVGNVAVNLVWSPPWTPDRIEPRVRAYLGF
ncbi:MAG: metal-sulfur cluster assembly factor [Gemmatimonadaceae bacterium]|nr:metal-sulfur cluster assembly factor [Gemmatimonadaceae bacterium]